MEIHDLLLSLREQGTTIFLTTHRMDEAMKLCDNIALLNNGVIVEYGSPESICLKYNVSKSIIITLKSGEKITLPHKPESVDAITKYMNNGDIVAIHSSEPKLEDVFLSVTNKEGAEL